MHELILFLLPLLSTMLTQVSVQLVVLANRSEKNKTKDVIQKSLAVKICTNTVKKRFPVVLWVDTFRVQSQSKWKYYILKRHTEIKRDTSEAKFSSKRQTEAPVEFLPPLATEPLICDSIPAPLYSASLLSCRLRAPYIILGTKPLHTWSGCTRQELQYFRMCWRPECPVSILNLLIVFNVGRRHKAGKTGKSCFSQILLPPLPRWPCLWFPADTYCHPAIPPLSQSSPEKRNKTMLKYH